MGYKVHPVCFGNIRAAASRQWKYSPGVPIPELTELVAAAEDESYTWDTGDEESYQTNDGFG